MIKLSDYVVRTLADWGVRDIFMMTGGGAMHLNDSIGQESRIRYICTHHEQVAAMAAEGYSRVSGLPGVVNVTTGPGGINALNGVFGAWTDSIAMLVLSGQVKRQTCMATAGTRNLRQLGDQEVNIVSMVRGVTKYAQLIDDPTSIRYHLERAWRLCRTGRPGPCWLDIPIDVQSAQIDETALRAYDPAEDAIPSDPALLQQQVQEVIERITAAKRPVLLAGTGVRLAGALDEFEQAIRKLQIPVTTAWTHDLIASDDPLYCGRPGTIGDRAGNFTVQNADLVLVLGSRLNLRQVSYNWSSFAPDAFKIQVDVDPAELSKPLVTPDLAIAADLKLFLANLVQTLDRAACQPRHAPWLAWCRQRVSRYPVVQDRQRLPGPPLNPYYFMELLSARLAPDDVVICGNASACILPFQVMKIRRGQRLISNSGAASMGYDLPASIGAAVARNGKRVICLAGDGSLQLNIQDLQTVVYHQLPVKLFVLNNGGYLSIRSTQKNFFGRLMGEGPRSGVSFPDFVKVGNAYGLPSIRVDCATGMDKVQSALDTPGPALIEIMLDPEQEFEPRSRSKVLPDGTIVSPPLEDMYPFLSPEELAANKARD
ncbi:MAG TPA: thiamine pyrophosphate-binding protein [Candidatus Saccharimonadales bacterium]|nr:thiamine pyrophosphate-binding protein [Candidatus Saccharimonadales bacterium]